MFGEIAGQLRPNFLADGRRDLPAGGAQSGDCAGDAHQLRQQLWGAARIRAGVLSMADAGLLLLLLLKDDSLRCEDGLSMHLLLQSGIPFTATG